MAPAAAPATAATEPAAEIERKLQSEDLRIAGVDILAHDTLLKAYRAFDFQPFWTDRRNIRDLQGLVGGATEHGLNPEDYGAAAIRQLLAGDPPGAAKPAADTDILLTESLFRYVYHRRYGKIRASTLDPDVNYRREAFSDEEPGTVLHNALRGPSLTTFVDSVAPAGPVYRALQGWLLEYRRIEAAGGWPLVPDGPTLHPGDSDARVTALRRRLAPDSGEETRFFDADLEQAVRNFQRRHALAEDGIVGQLTLAALNVPVQWRIDQLRLSLERLRWVNQEAAHTLVAVNIAGFRVFYLRDGEVAWETRAMVGKSYRQTPTFRGEMTYLELNPTWTIPPTILRNDTLPAIRKDIAYLESNRIRVLDAAGHPVDPAGVDWSLPTGQLPYIFRQEPGPHNALGRIKFMFPNPHFVFLHDTPHRELFQRAERAFSSGCIRVENPLELAERLLGDPGKYSRSALEYLVGSGETRRLVLSEPIPVLIVYLTASIDEAGGVLFYRDIYSRDQRTLDALNGPVTFEPPAPK